MYPTTQLTVDHVIRWLYSGFSTIFHTLEMNVVTVCGSVSSSWAIPTTEVRDAIFREKLGSDRVRETIKSLSGTFLSDV